LPAEVQERLREHTRSIGRELGRDGYRGIFGCDYILTEDARIYLVEVNARKQGTTMEMCCTLENSLPEGTPTLLELEYCAVTTGHFPENVLELTENVRDIHWGTYNYKVETDVLTGGFLHQFDTERGAFRMVARDRHAAGRRLIMEHVGRNRLVKKGAFLGRIAVVGRDGATVIRALREGRQLIRETIERELDDDEHGECGESGGRTG
jgi:hypothetical protein